ncbi:AcrR family transcriptional regulator [Caulobacter ginsengisoli]|uniref:AcrR family transcriptional regulator n=1 Tax=Caulobacter ginsengisoli TaxID=400775 RepID=A0ABU0INQ0_9CAUL|nr:TetR/AcrR family transcriptional regulator [Caulobacter ginsengisoli]MDQ0463643.1 AcrR family transcriptional regulator [Caulobacter ginsengisoli]
MTTDDPRGRILDAAEALLRRHGPDKLAVVDVARALGMSHANVYRYFGSKTELFGELVARWLGRLEGPLAAIAAEPGPAPDRLKRWALTLHRQKREKVSVDPEMFAAFDKAAEMARPSVAGHLAHLHAQLTAILADGKAAGLWPGVTEHSALDVFTAISPFSHPALVLADGATDRSAQLARVIDLIDAGLRSST